MPKPPPRPKPVKHRWLDQWLAATGEPLRRLVERTRAFVEHDEQSEHARQRRRRPTEEEHHRRRIEVIVANLALAVLDPPATGRIAVDASQAPMGAHPLRQSGPWIEAAARSPRATGEAGLP